jgi:hypothetical protein
VIDKRVQKVFALLVRQAALVYHLHDVAALIVRCQVAQQCDGGLKYFCSLDHAEPLAGLRVLHDPVNSAGKRILWAAYVSIGILARCGWLTGGRVLTHSDTDQSGIRCQPSCTSEARLA